MSKWEDMYQDIPKCSYCGVRCSEYGLPEFEHNYCDKDGDWHGLCDDCLIDVGGDGSE